MTLVSDYDRENRVPSASASMMPELDEEAVPSGCPSILGGDVDALPKKEGPVMMLQTIPGTGRKVPVPVIFRVYSTSFGKYAVVAQDKLLCKDCGYIKLRNCSVRPLVTSPIPKTSQRPLRQTNNSQNRHPGFEIISQRGEGESLQFYVKDSTELSDWLSVLEVDDNGANRLRSVSEPVVIRRPKLTSSNVRRTRSLSSPKSLPAMPSLSEESEE